MKEASKTMLTKIPTGRAVKHVFKSSFVEMVSTLSTDIHVVVVAQPLREAFPLGAIF